MGPFVDAAHGPPLVLVADPVDHRRGAYVASLLGEGYRVEQASTTADTLAKARELSPTVVVVDLSLPMDGCEITHALKANADSGELCIVALVSPSEPKRSSTPRSSAPTSASSSRVPRRYCSNT